MGSSSRGCRPRRHRLVRAGVRAAVRVQVTGSRRLEAARHDCAPEAVGLLGIRAVALAPAAAAATVLAALGCTAGHRLREARAQHRNGPLTVPDFQHASLLEQVSESAVGRLGEERRTLPADRRGVRAQTLGLERVVEARGLHWAHIL